MKERVLWLDNLKGVLIFLVVLGHCIQFTSPDPDTNLLFNFIYSFHMPLFMFLSGYACYKSDVKFSIIGKRFIQLIIPFMSFNAINAILIGNNYFIYFTNPQTGLWFLWALFFITILQVAVCIFSHYVKSNEELLTLFLFVSLFVFCKALRVTIFAVDMIVSFWLYYAMGFFLRKHNYLLLKKYNNVIVSLIIVVSLILSLTFNRAIVPYYIGFVPHILYIRLVPVICICALVIIFSKYTNTNILTLKHLGGRRSVYMPFIFSSLQSQNYLKLM